MSRSGIRVWGRVLALVLALLLAVGCESATEPGGEQAQEASALRLTSSAFDDGGTVPTVYTCDGDDISPPLSWSGAPPGTRTFALVMDDPDAPLGVWVHWVVFNIPAEVQWLPEGIPSELDLDNGARQGLNSWDHTGYGGPCPPTGTHRYVFTLYALDGSLGLDPEESGKQEVLDAVEGHVPYVTMKVRQLC